MGFKGIYISRTCFPDAFIDVFTMELPKLKPGGDPGTRVVSRRTAVQVSSPSKLDRDGTRKSHLDLAVAVNVARFTSKFAKRPRTFDPEATFCYDSSDGKRLRPVT